MVMILKNNIGDLELFLTLGMKDLMSMIQGDIGKKDMEDITDIAPTVWGAVQEAWAHITKMQETMHVLGNNVVAIKELIWTKQVLRKLSQAGQGSPYISGGVLPATALCSNQPFYKGILKPKGSQRVQFIWIWIRQ